MNQDQAISSWKDQVRQAFTKPTYKMVYTVENMDGVTIFDSEQEHVRDEVYDNLRFKGQSVYMNKRRERI